MSSVFLKHFPPYFLRQYLSLNLKLINWLVQLASKVPESFHFPACAGITGMPTTPKCLHGCWEPEQVLILVQQALY